MTIKDIHDQLEKIRKSANEREIAEPHELEDRLHRDVLRAIAEERIFLQDAAEFAKLALSSLKIKFARYYA